MSDTTKGPPDLAEAVVEAVAAAIPGVTKEYLSDVPIDKVHVNPWNPNVQDDRTYAATRESIREFGFIDPTTVWPHPDIAGEWMTLDGEHRGRAARDEGLEAVDIVVLHGLSPAQARRLTLIMNETRGDPDIAKLGVLLNDIQKLSEEGANIGAGLPYSDAELKHLIEIGNTDWDAFHATNNVADGGSNGAGRDPNLAVVLSFADVAGKEKYETFMAMQQREHEGETPEQVLLRVLAEACKNL